MGYFSVLAPHNYCPCCLDSFPIRAGSRPAAAGGSVLARLAKNAQSCFSGCLGSAAPALCADRYPWAAAYACDRSLATPGLVCIPTQRFPAHPPSLHSGKVDHHGVLGRTSTVYTRRLSRIRPGRLPGWPLSRSALRSGLCGDRGRIGRVRPARVAVQLARGYPS